MARSTAARTTALHPAQLSEALCAACRGEAAPALGRVDTGTGLADGRWLEVDLRDPLAHGLDDLEGRGRLHDAGEVVVNEALADRGPGWATTGGAALRGRDG